MNSGSIASPSGWSKTGNDHLQSAGHAVSPRNHHRNLMAWRLFAYLQMAGVGSILATVCTGAVMFFVMLVGAFVIAGMYG